VFLRMRDALDVMMAEVSGLQRWYGARWSGPGGDWTDTGWRVNAEGTWWRSLRSGRLVVTIAPTDLEILHG
jgi:hypothetical protein